MRERFSLGLRDTVVVIVPAAFGFVVLAGPITSLLLEHGAADAADAALIARTLQGFAVGLPFFSAFQLITRTFYATQDSRTPALINVGAAAVYGRGRRRPRRHRGLGRAGPRARTCRVLRRRDGRRPRAAPREARLDRRRPRHRHTIVRTLAAAVVTALAAWLVAAGVAAVVDTQPVAGDGRAGGTSRSWRARCVYLGAALMFGMQEVDEVVGAVRRRFRG